MAHFDDLSPYRYSGKNQPGVVHVGWLERGHEYARGKVRVTLLWKMKRMAQVPCELYRGRHICDLCEMPVELVGKSQAEEWERQRRGSGEIRVSSGGITYAAPVLITHYIEAHGYLPPIEFLRALGGWHWFREPDPKWRD